MESRPYFNKPHCFLWKFKHACVLQASTYNIFGNFDNEETEIALVSLKYFHLCFKDEGE